MDSKKVWGILWCVLLVWLMFRFVDCGNNKTNQKEDSFNFKQNSYFKSSNKYRCFVFSIEGNPSEKQIYNHAKNQMNTSGRTTSVFYFDEYNYKDITLSNSYNEAFTFCLNLNWKYRFDKYPNGKESFYRLEGDNAIQVNL